MIVVVPPVTIKALTAPLFMSIVALAGVALDHTPLATVFVNVVTVPGHAASVPPIPAG